MRARVLLWSPMILLAACATATPTAIDDDDDPVDARRDDAAAVDAAPPTDGTPVPDIDARLVDAPPGCTGGTTQLLVNPSFDLAPLGTGWTQTLIDPAYPVITADTPASLTPNTLPNHAWMGGFEEGSDSIEQTVTVPVGTTQLTLTGVRLTATQELGSTVYDTSTIKLLNSSGGLLETAMTFSNATTNTAYAAFSKSFATAHAGETVRLRFDAVQDGSYATNFFYDSLALTAIVTCP